MKNHVLFVTVILQLNLCSALMSHEELSAFMAGYVGALKISSKNSSSLVSSCIDDSVSSLWLKATSIFDEAQEANWTSPTTALNAFASLVTPAIESLGSLIPCANNEISAAYSRISALLGDEKALERRVTENLDVISQALREMEEHWRRSDSAHVGKVLGALIYWLLLN